MPRSAPPSCSSGCRSPRFPQATCNELQTQITSLRQRTSAAGSDPATATKITVLTTRASTAERRVIAYQTQLASAEDKLGEARKKVSVAEGKWEARLRELETRLRAAEEKLKRERQGAKEKVDDLAATIECVRFRSRVAKLADEPLAEQRPAEPSRGCEKKGSPARRGSYGDGEEQGAGEEGRQHRLSCCVRPRDLFRLSTLPVSFLLEMPLVGSHVTRTVFQGS